MSEGIRRHCGSPQRMPRTEHSGNQEFRPLTPPSGKRRTEEESSSLQVCCTVRVANITPHFNSEM